MQGKLKGKRKNQGSQSSSSSSRSRRSQRSQISQRDERSQRSESHFWRTISVSWLTSISVSYNIVLNYNRLSTLESLWIFSLCATLVLWFMFFDICATTICQCRRGQIDHRITSVMNFNRIDQHQKSKHWSRVSLIQFSLHDIRKKTGWRALLASLLCMVWGPIPPRGGKRWEHTCIAFNVRTQKWTPPLQSAAKAVT